MTLSAVYMDDLSRVRLTLDALPEGTVRVERSVNQNLWSIVRGGRQVEVGDFQVDLDDFEFYQDATTHYRAVPVDPDASLMVSGGAHASTPDRDILDLGTGGQFEIKAALYVEALDGVGVVVAKWSESADDRAYMLAIETDGTFSLHVSSDGTDSIVYTSDLAAPVQQHFVIWVDWQGETVLTSRAHFQIGPTWDGPWQDAGTHDEDVVAQVHDSADDVTVGSAVIGGQVWSLHGRVYEVELVQGISTIVASPDFTAQTAGTSSFDDAQGNTWTVSSGAELVGTGETSITVDLAGETWLKNLRWPSLNRTIGPVDVGGTELPARNTLTPVPGSSLEIGVTDKRLGRRYTLSLLVHDQSKLEQWEAILGRGGVVFLQTPVDEPPNVRGGYYVVGNVGDRTLTGVAGSFPRVLELPLTATRPPGPDMVGSTMTWGAIWAAYGTAENLWSSHETWRSVWDEVADPSDVVEW